MRTHSCVLIDTLLSPIRPGLYRSLGRVVRSCVQYRGMYSRGVSLPRSLKPFACTVPSLRQRFSFSLSLRRYLVGTFTFMVSVRDCMHVVLAYRDLVAFANREAVLLSEAVGVALWLSWQQSRCKDL